MKKKIIFMIINMNIGGTEKALLNMISEMPKDKFEITILMLEKKGGFLKSIPKQVKVEYIQEYDQIKDLLNMPPRTVLIDFLKKGKVIKAFNVIFFHLVSKIKKDRNNFYRYILFKYPKIENEYDVAVAYAGPMDFISYFVINKIIAKKKVQWIHFDVTKIGFNKNFATKIYKKFDKIFIVSNEAKTKLNNIIPSLYDKTEVFYNIVSPKEIRKQATEGVGFNDDFNGVRILTVGRLTKEKGHDLAINVLARLIEEGYNIRWYCIGDGVAREEYERLIIKNNLENNFVLLGANTNPYTYLKQCDLYVQPSRYEGYCITLIEAKIFNKPIITTDVNGAKELIKDGETGLIVNIDEKEIYLGLKKLINNKLLCNKFSSNLSKETYDSSSEKIIRVMEG